MDSSNNIDELIEVRESKRAKKCSLKYRNGLITVVVPKGRTVNIGDLIQNNPDFFDKYIEEARKFREKIPERDLRPGGSISLLGKEKTIEVGKRRSNKVSDKILLAEHLVERTSLIDQLEKCLRSEARSLIEGKLEKYSDKISKDFDRIFIRDQKTRWGSCSGKGNLNFNWRLILGPEHVFDYVIVHELVHLEERNHSESFWSRVEEVYPDYRKSNEWLENESAKLIFDKSCFE